MAGKTRKTSGIYLRGKTWWINYMGVDRLQKFESTGSKLKADADYMLACRKKFATTLNDLAEKYLEFCKPQRDFKTKTCRVETLKQSFGSMKLINISLEDLEKYQSRRQTDMRPPKKTGDNPLPPVKPVTVNKELATLKHMFTKAEDWGLIPISTLNTVRKLKLAKVNNSRLRFLSTGESRNLIAVCGRGLKEIVTFALNTGCRRGEIFSLTWKHVDLEHGFIRIAESKNGESRDIPINPTIEKILKPLSDLRNSPFVFVNPETGKCFQAHDRGSREVAACALSTGCSKRELLSLRWNQVDLKRGTIRVADLENEQLRTICIGSLVIEILKVMQLCCTSPFVFVNRETGTRYQDVKKSFATACRSASIMDFHFHDLRHTFASQLVMAGVDLTTVSRLMGHKSLVMTLRYAHLAPNHLKKAVDLLTWEDQPEVANG